MNEARKVNPISVQSKTGQKKLNYTQLREEQIKLQTDFLSLTGQLETILQGQSNQGSLTLQEDSRNKFTSQKDHRKIEIASRGHPGQFTLQPKEPTRRPDELESEKEKNSHQSKVSQVKLDFLQKQIFHAIEQTKLSFESELNCLQKAKEQLEVAITQLTKLHDNEKVISLLEENSRLRCKLTQNKISFDESHFNFSKIYNQFKSLVSLIESHDEQNKLTLAACVNEMNKLREENEEKQITIRSNKRQFDSFIGQFERIKRQFNTSNEQLSNFEVKQQTELKELSRQNDLLQSQLNQVADEAAGCLKIKNQIQFEHEKLKASLQKEKEDLALFKVNSENSLNQLRAMVQEQRNVSADKIARLTESVGNLKEENSKLKFQVDHLTEIRENLSEELKSIERSISLAASVASGSNLKGDQWKSEPQLSKSMSHPVDLSADLQWREPIYPKVTFYAKSEPRIFPGLSEIWQSNSSSEVLMKNNGNNQQSNSIKFESKDKNNKHSQPRESICDGLLGNLTINRTNELFNCDQLDDICNCKHFNQSFNYPIHREKYLSFVKCKSSPKKNSSAKSPKSSCWRNRGDDELQSTQSSVFSGTINKFCRGSSAPPKERKIAPGRSNLNNFYGQTSKSINTQPGSSCSKLNYAQLPREFNCNLKNPCNKVYKKQQK